MGLLDSLLSGSQGGYGGLLDALMYPSPLTQKDNYATNEFDSQFLPQRPDPFGPVPNYGAPRDFSPPSAFNGSAPAAPIQFAGAPMQPQAPALPPPQNVAPPPQVAPPQNTANIGGYQMPQIGNASDFTPQQPQMTQAGPSTDVSAQSRQPMQLPPALGGTQGDGGMGDRLMAGFQSWANTAPGNIIGGLANGISGLATGQRNDPVGLQQQNLRAQFEAFKGAGLSPQQAMLAVMNPEAAKTLVSEALTNKEKYGVVSDNPIEGKKYGFINEIAQTVNGKPLGAGGASGDQSGGMLAPGVRFDATKSGEDYINQFSPEVKAAVKSYINGDVLPSGNPRLQGIANVAKTIAQKYGQDIGVPVSDALYAEKRKYRTELGTNSANSAGGQAKAFNQGISHLTSLADNLERLDNSNGLGIPIVAQGVNAVRQGVSNQQSAISDEAKTIGQTVAGEVGKLFSGSAGGGVHERELTRERFDTVKSKPQLAAALRATLETMDGGLKALEQRRDAVLGPNSGVELVNESTRQNIAKIQGAIDRLEGKSPAMSGGLPSGWSVRVR